MEHFRDAYSVRLLGHTGKYLGASEDRKSVAQKKGKDSYGVIWRVELVADGTAIRLKSVYDLYLMASDYAFLLGATGKKVMQSRASKADSSLEWEPVSAGPNHVKLMTKGEKFLRANGGVPPYRNSVTHDVPVLASNQNVVLWEVDVVRKKDAASLPPSRIISPRVSNASQPSNASLPPTPQPQPQAESSDDDDDIPAPIIPKPRLRTNAAPPRIKIPPTAVDSSSPSEPASPVAPSPPPRRRATPQTEQPRRQAESVGNVPQRRRASPSTYDESPPLRPSRDAAYDESPPPRRRAGDADYDQSPPPRRRAGDADYDQSPPPRRRATKVYESPPPPRRQASPVYESPPPPRRRASPVYKSPPPPRRRASPVYESPPPPRRRAARREDYDSERGGGRPRQQRRDEYESSPEPSQSARPSARSSGYEDSENSARSGSQKVKSPDIRRIFYSVAEDDGEVLAHDDESFGTFMFKGHGLEELTAELQRVTGINEDIILCMRNPMSAKLYKMRLALPPNKAPLSIVIVRSDSQFGRTFSTQTSRQR